MKEKLTSAIIGLAVADALGVPVEFCSRSLLAKKPVADMQGYGTYNKPAGTWSDDTSMTLCLLDSLANDLDYTAVMQKFSLWLNGGEYTVDGVFDVGVTTQKAIARFNSGVAPLACGGSEAFDNGNGSLMRILPLAFYLQAKLDEKQINSDEVFSIIHKVSSLTHAHPRSLIACGIYISIALKIMENAKLKKAINVGIAEAWQHYENKADFSEELKHYQRLTKKDFAKISEVEIKSTGYVVATLEAALWCLLNTNNFKDCVLKAVNLGGDTDTIAAVAGGLAGMYYGLDAIPATWLEQTKKLGYIRMLCDKLSLSLK